MQCFKLKYPNFKNKSGKGSIIRDYRQEVVLNLKKEWRRL